MTVYARRILAVLVCSLAAGCGGGGGGGGGGNGGGRTLTGTVSYDFVPATLGGSLVFAGATPKPVRNAAVQVLKGTTVLATATTDAGGNYSLSFTESGTGTLQVVAIARTSSPAIQVQDNTDGNALWAIGADLGPTTTVQNLHATHGWTGLSYGAARTAAPFAILDSMYTAARAFVAVRPAVAFPELHVNWSPNNAPEAGDKTLGQIGTSHFTPSGVPAGCAAGTSACTGEIFILGKDGVDTDEYDSHVIVHEWGHYFEHNLSRSDSPGGPHGGGDVLDPRLSFGEGYGTSLAAMLLGDPVYVDTLWAGGSLAAGGMDAETEPVPSDDPSPSAFSETTIIRLLYDLFDSGGGEAFDGIGVGLGPIYDVLVGPERTTQALTTIASFVTGLKAQPGVSAAAVDALLAHYGIGPIADEWGSGDAGMSGMYIDVTTLASCGAACFTTPFFLGGGFGYNKWEQNQYFVFGGDGSPVTVSASSAEDVALVVYQGGDKVAVADALNTGGTESVQVGTAAGKIYVVNLVGFGATPGNYQVDLMFTSP